MKIRIVGVWQFELVAETKREDRILRQTHAEEHIHFVCKAITQSARQRHPRLLLTPSLIVWKRPAKDESHDSA